MTRTDGTGSEILDEPTCLELLRVSSAGRVAVTRDALPLILPVAFGLLDGDPVMRAGAGAVWNAGRRGSVVCFEADRNRYDWSGGWSVVVIGRAELVSSPGDLAAACQLGLPDWRVDPDGADGFVRIRRELMTGRRFRRLARTATRSVAQGDAVAVAVGA